MAIHRSLIAIIAKKNPAIWEEIIGPLGPMKRLAAVALNPQPLPPKAIVRGLEASLNPQPLPPGVDYGFAVGAELVRAAGIAQLLHTGFDVVVDDICPPPRPWPPIPWPPAPWPPEPWGPRDEFDPEFVFGYAVGLAFALETSAHAWERLDGAGSLEQLHEAAFKTAEQFG
ncbi:MAG TPA: hypothetical protein VNT50_03940 [Microbacterium sp.]|uniref:hypothetical protein n=1 Tax=Microbacterium sp. TaxID=51671 RepID=UPI002CA31D09|nr:hypothetical protein [Microbacterium sp.]HWI30616.1 hypothetical protein [Microbacterium sp.]